jgi:hypothetical protein
MSTLLQTADCNADHTSIHSEAVVDVCHIFKALGLCNPCRKQGMSWRRTAPTMKSLAFTADLNTVIS